MKAGIIFDFDKTLAKYDVFNYLRKGGVSDVRMIFSSFIRGEEFRLFLKKSPYKLFVLSFGYGGLIRELLAEIGLLKYFTFIFTPASFGLIDGIAYTRLCYGKNKMMETIARKYGLKKYILIDDNIDNILWCKKGGIDYIYVKGGEGFSKGDLEKLKKKIDLWNVREMH